MINWIECRNSRRTKTPGRCVPVACAALMALCAAALAGPVKLTEPERVLGTGGLTGAAFHPGGEYFATWGWRGVVYLWDAETGEPAGEIPGDADSVTHTAFSPDGDYVLISMFRRDEAEVRDVETGEIVQALAGHTDWIRYGAFSADGTRAITTSTDSTAIIWNAGTGEALQTLKHDGLLSGPAALSPEGTHVLAGAGNGTAILWDVETGGKLRTLDAHKDDPDPFGFDGDYQDPFGFDGDLPEVWEEYDPDDPPMFGKGGEEVELTEVPDAAGFTGFADPSGAMPPGFGVTVSAVAFSPDGEFFLTGSSRGTVRLWDAQTGEEVRKFTDEMSSIDTLAFSPSGGQFLAAGLRRDGEPATRNQVLLLDTETGEVLRSFKGHAGRILTATFSPDGKRVLTSSRDETARVWDAETGGELLANRAHTHGVTATAFSPDGTTAATGQGRGTAILWDKESGEELGRLLSDKMELGAVVFSPCGKQLLGAELFDRSAVLWDISTGEILHTLRSDWMPLIDAVFSPRGDLILTGVKVDDDITAQMDEQPPLLRMLHGVAAALWDAETGEKIDSFPTHREGTVAVGFSPDGTEAYIADRNDRVRIWHIATDRRRGVSLFVGRNASVTACAFSPDGNAVLAGSEDGSLRLRDMTDGSVIRTFPSHDEAVAYIHVSADGSRALAMDERGTAIIWDIEAAEPEYTFRLTAPPALSPCGEWALAAGPAPGVSELWHAPARE